MSTSNDISGFDQVTDTNQSVWHAIKMAYGLPDSLRDSLDEVPPTMRNKDYADLAFTLFPLHNPGHVKVSAAYFYHQRSTMPGDRIKLLEERLNKVAEFFGIQGEVDRIAQAILEKQAYSEDSLPDSDFALVWFDPIGKTTDRRYPLRNTMEVKTAATYLIDNRIHFAYADRRTMAMKVLQKAATLGMELPEREVLLRTAGGGVCSSETLAEVIMGRFLQMKNAGAADETQLEYLQATMPFVDQAKIASLPPSELTKVAELIDMYDRRMGLNLQNELSEDQLFLITPDNAGRALRDHVAIQTGAIYSLDKVAQLPLNKLREVMGESFTKEISFSDIFVERGKAAEHLPSLSPRHAQLFEDTARSLGLEPVYRQNTAPVKIDPVALVELARMFPSY